MKDEEIRVMSTKLCCMTELLFYMRNHTDAEIAKTMRGFSLLMDNGPHTLWLNVEKMKLGMLQKMCENLIDPLFIDESLRRYMRDQRWI